MAGPRGKDPAKGGGVKGAPAGAKAGHVTTPPVAAGGPELQVGAVVEDLFERVQSHAARRECVKVVRLADEILKLLPGDEDAVRCKVVAQVQDELYDAALATIASKDAAGVDLRPEKGYCLYRKACHEEALSALQGCEKSPSVLQLEAQILYRMGDSEGAIQRYEELGKMEDENTTEIKTNMVAAYVSGGRAAEVPALMKTLEAAPKESFDLAYNVACSMVESGELSQAEEMLLISKRMGKEMLIDEELTEPEIEQELAPINVQLAFVQQALGRSTEAMEKYSSLLKNRPGDAPSMAVASNNLIALRGPKDLLDGLKKFEKIFESNENGAFDFAEAVRGKLSVRQKAAILKNRFLLLLHSNKFEQARETLSLFKPLLPPEEVLSLSLSLMVKEKQLQQALLSLPPSGGTPLLLWVQTAVLAGDFLRAAAALEGAEDLKYQPAVVATLVDLKERGNDLAGAEATLDGAIRWWESHRMYEDSAKQGSLTAWDKMVLAAASLKQRRTDPRSAASLFERLLSSPSEAVRAEALNGLVCSAAEYDADLAEQYAAALPAVPGAASLDPSALERAASGPFFGSRAKRTAENGELADMEQEAARRKKRRKRKRKVVWPKGYDPANPPPPPDPERWLPRRERAGYRPRKKDKRAGVQIRGAQGAVVKEKAGEKAGEGGSVSSSEKGGKKGEAVAAAAAAAKAKGKSSSKKKR